MPKEGDREATGGFASVLVMQSPTKQEKDRGLINRKAARQARRDRMRYDTANGRDDVPGGGRVMDQQSSSQKRLDRPLEMP